MRKNVSFFSGMITDGFNFSLLAGTAGCVSLAVLSCPSPGAALCLWQSQPGVPRCSCSSDPCIACIALLLGQLQVPPAVTCQVLLLLLGTLSLLCEYL